MKLLPPFKFFALQSFPFLEYDFDALTNYELMCKIAEYMKKEIIPRVNENTTDIKNLIKWIESLDLTDEVNAKLDEMAEDGTLAHIINEEIFNELNTIVQSDTLTLNDECKIYFPYRGENGGDCTVIRNSNKTILIDLGVSVSSLITWLSNKGLTKIDYIIISHYHADHIAGDGASGFETLLESDVIDTSDTIVYLPHKDIDWSRIIDAEKTTLMTNETTIKGLCTTYNLTYVEPDNNQLLVLSTISNMKFLNIGSQYYNSYYGLSSNEYNNFSMVVELTHNNRHALFTGDIVVEAESNIAGIIKEPDVIKAPHHDLEPIYAETFLKKINSKIMMFFEWFNYYGSGLTTQLAQAIKNNGGSIYDTNNSHDVVVTLKNDNILVNSTNGVFNLQNVGILNASGIHLQENTDLNNVMENGTFYTNSNTETRSLGHLPMAVQYAFSERDEDLGRCKLVNITLNMFNNIIKQIFTVTGSTWIRTYHDNAWDSWKLIEDDGLFGFTDNFIPENADLNNYVESGKFLIGNNAIYNSLSHTPVIDGGGSILLVIKTRIDTDILHQVLITGSGLWFTRKINRNKYNTGTTEISSWYQFNMTEIT